jgi:hypothetical protein
LVLRSKTVALKHGVTSLQVAAIRRSSAGPDKQEQFDIAWPRMVAMKLPRRLGFQRN